MGIFNKTYNKLNVIRKGETFGFENVIPGSIKEIYFTDGLIKHNAESLDRGEVKDWDEYEFSFEIKGGMMAFPVRLMFREKEFKWGKKYGTI